MQLLSCDFDILYNGQQIKQPSKLAFWRVQLHIILGHPGVDSGGEGKSKRAEKYGTKKSKER